MSRTDPRTWGDLQPDIEGTGPGRVLAEYLSALADEDVSGNVDDACYHQGRREAYEHVLDLLHTPAATPEELTLLLVDVDTDEDDPDSVDPTWDRHEGKRPVLLHEACGARDDLIEVDVAERWNTSDVEWEFDHPYKVVETPAGPRWQTDRSAPKVWTPVCSYSSNDGDGYQHQGYLCGGCEQPVTIPAGVELNEDWS